MSIGWAAVIVWLTPFSAVEPNATLGGVLTKPSEPAVSVAVADVASADGATSASATAPIPPSATPLASASHSLWVACLWVEFCISLPCGVRQELDAAPSCDPYKTNVGAGTGLALPELR